MFVFWGFTFVPLLLYLIKGLVGSGDGGSLTVTAPVGVLGYLVLFADGYGTCAVCGSDLNRVSVCVFSGKAVDHHSHHFLIFNFFIDVKACCLDLCGVILDLLNSSRHEGNGEAVGFGICGKQFKIGLGNELGKLVITNRCQVFANK